MRKLYLFLLMGGISLPLWAQDLSFVRVEDCAMCELAVDASSASWGDFNRDGFPDLFITTGERGERNHLFENLCDGRFRLRRDLAPSQDSDNSFGSAWGDANNDGWLDLYVTNNDYLGPAGLRNFYYENRGDGTFTKITSGNFVKDPASSHGCGWADYNLDGWLDLVVANHYSSPNHQFRNKGDGTFARVYGGSLVESNFNELALAWIDYDQDGDPDLSYGRVDGTALLYRNEGNGQFKQIYNPFPNSPYNVRTLSWADYDNDGWPDVVISPGDGEAFLYRNQGDGSFLKVPKTQFWSPLLYGKGSSWGDLDNDGDQDLILGSMRRNVVVMINQGDGSFERMPSLNLALEEDEGLATYGITLADYNNDGCLDVFYAIRWGDNRLFRNNSSPAYNWVHVDLEGVISNRVGIGAKIRVYANVLGQQSQQLREVSSQSGGDYANANDLRAHFGLGDATEIDSLVVEWPSGLHCVYTELPLNSFLTLVEDCSWSAREVNEQILVQSPTELCPEDSLKLATHYFREPVHWFHADQPDLVLREGQRLDLAGWEVEDGWYIAEGANGERDSVAVILKDCTARLVMPNWFSPNDDGINDRFHPQQANLVARYEIWIFDRWGRELYHSRNIDGWDGTFKGQILPEGTYYFYVEYHLEDTPFQQQVKGPLSLYR